MMSNTVMFILMLCAIAMMAVALYFIPPSSFFLAR